MKSLFFNKILVFGYVLACLAGQLSAQDLMTGDIFTKHISGYTYETIVTLYAKDTNINRDTIVIDWGDSTIDTLVANSETVINDLRILTYKSSHVYPGDGIYSVVYEANYRIADIVNIPLSQSKSLRLEQELIISSSYNNSSVQFASPPYDIAALDQVYSYWPGAYESDGDSLSYALKTPLGSATFPVGMSIDKGFGNLTWDSPANEGYFAVAFEVIEWRNAVVISRTHREMLVRVDNYIGNLTESDVDLSSLKIYPNPFSEYTTILIQSAQQDYDLKSISIELYDLLGRRKEPVRTVVHNRNEVKEIRLYKTNLSPGVYFYTIENKLEMITSGKLIVQ